MLLIINLFLRQVKSFLYLTLCLVLHYSTLKRDVRSPELGPNALKRIQKAIMMDPSISLRLASFQDLGRFVSVTAGLILARSHILVPVPCLIFR